MKKILLLVLACNCYAALFSQNFVRLDATVMKDDTPMLSPWAGGVNAPQWSEVDLNGDGKLDLYSFDRDGDQQATYLNTGADDESKYEFAPEYLANFPRVFQYVLLRDYNFDGAMDLFAYAGDESIAGLKVFRGYFQDGKLAFERVKFPQTAAGDVLTIEASNGFNTNLNVSEPDYPAIDDIDGDGDLDVLSIFSTTGRQFVYYRNMSLEKGFTVDTLLFKQEEVCWAGLSIPTLTTCLELSVHPDSCAPVMQEPVNATDRSGPMHGAGTLCTFDSDNDGDKELLYGDLQFTAIICAKNGGDVDQAWANSQDCTFPSYDSPVEMDVFPASFILDMDNDGIKDFVVSPNKFGSSTRDRDCVWFYKNTGTNELPTFSKIRENMIERDMIDVGTAAQPAFVDYNADGLMDFVVGNFSAWTPSAEPNESFLQLFLNTGTATEPAFELVDDNLLNFKQYSSVASAFAPAFGDLDGDGDQDMLVGEDGGTLFYVENTAGAGNPSTWGAVQPFWQQIDIGKNATPFIFDVNKDGLVDLLIGNFLGTIGYFPNQGTATDPQFEPDPSLAPNNRKFGNVSVQITQTSTGYAAPVVLSFMDVDYLITGSQEGYIVTHIINQDSLEAGTFELFDDQLGGALTGTHSRITFANINQDDFLDAIIGNHRGGLSLYTSPFQLDGSVSTSEKLNSLEFDVYPNPARDVLRINFSAISTADLEYTIFNTLGQRMKQGQLNSDTNAIMVDDLQKGIYLVQVKLNDRTGIRKVIIE